jgi:adhesin/invasin
MLNPNLSYLKKFFRFIYFSLKKYLLLTSLQSWEMFIFQRNICMSFRNKQWFTHSARLLIWGQIALQALFPIISTLPVHAAETAILVPSGATDNATSPLWNQTLTAAASGMASENLQSTATGLASSTTAASVQQWLNQFGTARVNINVDDDGKWDQSSVDLLTPLYDNKKVVWFTQLGMRAPDGRVTGNFGTGIRTFYTENWMLGANVFMDDDFTGKNRRVGLGGEAWTNYFKLSANTYVGTTDWHSSRDFDDYNEKPADGYDVRAEAYLPAYPQLGAKFMFEQYYGDNVALFDKDHLQSNPTAVSTGVSYTPVPLVSLAVNYRQGQDSMNDTQFQMNLRYDFGHDWRYQMDPENVRSIRTLAGSRYDLVERNNQIILQYKKKEVADMLGDLTLSPVKDNSPADGSTVNTVTVHATTTDNIAMKNAPINWAVTGSAKLSAQSGVTDANGDAFVNITNSAAEQVTVTATSGSISRSAPSTFTQSVASVNLQLTKDNSQANGTDANSGQITVTDGSGKALSGVSVSWKVNNGATITTNDAVTNNSGVATAQFTSTTAGPVQLTASAGNKTESVKSIFSVQSATAVAVTMTTNNVQADGTAVNVAKAVVTNANNQPLAGVSVTWSLGTGSAIATTPLTVTTDSNGVATISLSDTIAQDVTVSASSGGQSGKTTATFVAVAMTAVVTITTDGSPADGVTQNIAQVTVMQGSTPVKNATVQWSKTSSNAKFASASSTTTNGQGIATLALKDGTAETFTVTATVNSTLVGSADTTFATPAFGPIAITMPEAGNPPRINIFVASGGTAVEVAAYNGMATGDEIAFSSSVSGDAQGKTLPYTSTHIVSSGEVGQSISFTIPETDLMEVEGNPTAKLNVNVDVTQGQVTKSATLSAAIDTCAPGDTVCGANKP